MAKFDGKRYIGLTYPRIFANRFVRIFWKRFLCPRNMHQFDEMLTIDEHVLVCDACDFAIPIKPRSTKEGEPLDAKRET